MAHQLSMQLETVHEAPPGVVMAWPCDHTRYYTTPGNAVRLPKLTGDEVFQVQLEPGDYLLLCSDGLSGEVDDPMILSIALDKLEPQLICQQLVAAANEGGGEDNITVIVIQAKAAH